MASVGKRLRNGKVSYRARYRDLAAEGLDALPAARVADPRDRELDQLATDNAPTNARGETR